MIEWFECEDGLVVDCFEGDEVVFVVGWYFVDYDVLDCVGDCCEGGFGICYCLLFGFYLGGELLCLGD